MKVARLFTTDHAQPFEGIEFEARSSRIANPNGSVADIAGVFNRDKNVLGLMPHPENLIESAHGGLDGRALFSNLLQVA